MYSAIIEHTNRVLYLEDDDVAAISNGRLTIHRLDKDTLGSGVREVKTLMLELEQIMKGQLI